MRDSPAIASHISHFANIATHFMLGSVPVSRMLSLRSSSARWLRVLMASGTVPSSLLLPSLSWVRKLAAAMALGSVPDRLRVAR